MVNKMQNDGMQNNTEKELKTGTYSGVHNLA